LHPSLWEEDEFGDLARCEALVGESVSLFVVSPLRILFVRKEGLGDVEACLLGQASAPSELHVGEFE
jgi:hypothetical protein